MCSEEDYKKFENKEMFWKYQNLVTAEDIYEEFTKPYKEDRSKWSDWDIEFFEEGLCGKLPSLETFKKAIAEETEFRYVRLTDRKEFDDEESWIIANIQSWCSSEDVANSSNYSYNGDYYYETFYDSFNGVVAFGYYGHD